MYWVLNYITQIKIFMVKVEKEKDFKNSKLVT